MDSRICSDIAAAPQVATKQTELSSERPFGSYIDLEQSSYLNHLVLVVDNTVLRCRWLLGRVTRMFPGEYMGVRTAEVETKSSRLVRPVTKLCLLEEAT